MYDSSKTRNLLSMAGGFAQHPQGEYIADIAKQLQSAETAIAEAVAAKVKAEGESNRYATELEQVQATVRRLREENAKLQAAVPAPAPVSAPAPAPAPKGKAKRQPRKTAKEEAPSLASITPMPKPIEAIPQGATPAPELAATGTSPAKRGRKKGAQ